MDQLNVAVKKYIEKNTRSVALPIKVLVVCGDVTYLLSPDDIIFTEKCNKQLNIHTAEKEFTIFGTLTEVEKKLPGYFFRSHSSYLINLHEIQGILPTGRSYLVKFNQINQQAILSYDKQKALIDQVCEQKMGQFEVSGSRQGKTSSAERKQYEYVCRRVKESTDNATEGNALGVASPERTLFLCRKFVEKVFTEIGKEREFTD